MKKLILLVFALVLSLNLFGQIQRQGRQNISDRIPRGEPTENDIAKRDRMIEERKDEFIANFLTTLEADEFQKQIIKQTINSYFVAQKDLYKIKFNHRIDQQAAAKRLKDSHFKELGELISEGDMAKIKEMISGGFDEKEVDKEKKKKRKKKKRKKDKD